MKKIALFVLLSMILPRFAMAQTAPLVVTIDNQVFNSSVSDQTGFFEVYVDIDPANLPAALNSFQVAISQSGVPVGLTFGTPTATSVHSELLGTTNFSPQNGVQVNTPLRITASNQMSGAGGSPFVDGSGLVRVPFTIAGGVSGVSYTLNVDTVNGFTDTNFFDGTIDANPIAFTTKNGTITVNPVPEPTTASFILIGMGALAARRRRA